MQRRRRSRADQARPTTRDQRRKRTWRSGRWRAPAWTASARDRAAPTLRSPSAALRGAQPPIAGATATPTSSASKAAFAPIYSTIRKRMASDDGAALAPVHVLNPAKKRWRRVELSCAIATAADTLVDVRARERSEMPQALLQTGAPPRMRFMSCASDAVLVNIGHARAERQSPSVMPRARGRRCLPAGRVGRVAMG